MNEKRFSGWAVILLVVLGVAIAAGSMVSGVFLGYQWGRSSGRSQALILGPHRFEPFMDPLMPQIVPPQAGRVQRPFLGVSFQMVTEELARQEDLSVDHGAWITGVVPGSPADQAGLREGDIIQAVDGTAVDRAHTLAALITAHKPGETVELSVLRGDRALTLEVELAARPGDLLDERGAPDPNFPRFQFQMYCFPEPCPHFEDRP